MMGRDTLIYSALEMGAQACAQIARYLHPCGWEPVVLTVRERYIKKTYTGSDPAFPGLVTRTRVMPHPLSIYRSIKARFRMNTNGTSAGGRSSPPMSARRRWALSLLSIPDIYTGWILPATISGLRIIRRLGVHHLFSSAPPWSNHLVGLTLARLTGLPWTVHFRDPWIQDGEDEIWEMIQGNAAHFRHAVAEEGVAGGGEYGDAGQHQILAKGQRYFPSGLRKKSKPRFLTGKPVRNDKP